jgi:hypothetical protein
MLAKKNGLNATYTQQQLVGAIEDEVDIRMSE